MDDQLRRTSGRVAVAVAGLCRVKSGVAFAAMLDAQLIVVSIRLARCDPIGQTVVERLVVLQPGHAGCLLVQLDLERGIIAGCAGRHQTENGLA